VQLELSLQLSTTGGKTEDRGFRQAVLLSSGAGRLPGSLTGSQSSYGTSVHVSFDCGWALGLPVKFTAIRDKTKFFCAEKKNKEKEAEIKTDFHQIT